MVRTLNKWQGCRVLTCCTYSRWSSRSQSSPWSLYLSFPAGSKSTQLPLMCAYWKWMSRLAAMNRSADAKSWHLMRPLKPSSPKHSSRTSICENNGEFEISSVYSGDEKGIWNKSWGSPAKTVCLFSAHTEAIESAISMQLITQTWKWNCGNSFFPWFLRAGSEDPVFRLPFVVVSMITTEQTGA